MSRKEISFYLTKQKTYGLPLDSLRDYTKLDWIVWEKILRRSSSRPCGFANESPSGVPLTDWYDTVSGKQEGLQARSVVGGVCIKLLASPRREH